MRIIDSKNMFRWAVYNVYMNPIHELKIPKGMQIPKPTAKAPEYLKGTMKNLYKSKKRKKL